MRARLFIGIGLAVCLFTRALHGTATVGGVIDFTKDDTVNAVYAAGYVPYSGGPNHFVLVFQESPIKISANITIQMFAEDVDFSVTNDYALDHVDIMSESGRRETVVVQTRAILKSLGGNQTDFDKYLSVPLTTPGDGNYWNYALEVGNIYVFLTFTQGLRVTGDGVVARLYVILTWDRPFDKNRYNGLNTVDRPPPGYRNLPLEKVPTIGPRPDPINGRLTVDDGGASRPKPIRSGGSGVRQDKAGLSETNSAASPDATSSLLAFITPWKVAIGIAVLVLLFLGWQKRSRG